MRAIISPKALLDDISKSVRRVDPDYLVGAWNAAVNAMEAHPDHAQSFPLAGGGPFDGSSVPAPGPPRPPVGGAPAAGWALSRVGTISRPLA